MQKTYLTKDCYPKIQRNKKTNNPIKTWVKDLSRHVTKEVIETADMHMKKCSTPNVSRELQIKTVMKYLCTPIGKAKIQNDDNTKS